MDIETFIAKQQELDDFAEKQGRVAFLEGIKTFFDDNPDAYAVRWRQYAPSFNDGDACVFGVNTPDVCWQAIEDEDDEDEAEEKFKYMSRSDKRCERLYDIWKLPERFFEFAFGSSSTVTVYRDLRLVVEDYEDC